MPRHDESSLDSELTCLNRFQQGLAITEQVNISGDSPENMSSVD